MSPLLERIQKLDEHLIQRSTRLHVHPLLTQLMVFVTFSCYGRGWIILLILLNILKYSGISLFHHQLLFHECLISALLALVIGWVIKKGVNRTRPFDSLEDHSATYESKSFDPSFPSNHSAAAVAFFVALAITGHPYAPIVGTWAALVAFSRFYLGVHYPSDILGGVFLGVGCGFAALNFINY